MRRIGDVELSEDLAHERREWIAERIGWAGMALLIAAALLGAFGSGPLADARAEGGGLEARYRRFARAKADSKVELVLPSGQLWVARAALDDYDLERITPQPDRTTLLADRWIYEFGAGGKVSLTLRPERPGHAAVRLGSGAAELRLEQWVYP